MTSRAFAAPIGVGLIALLASGCGKPPPEAPSSLGDVSIFLFEHFDKEPLAEVEDQAYPDLETAILSLELFMDDIDTKADRIDDRSWGLPELTTEHMGSIPEDERSPVSTSEQVPVAAAWTSAESPTDLDALALETNHVCLQSDTTVCHSRSFTSDEACYGDGSCDELTTSNEVHKRNLLAAVWYTELSDYRRITLEDGRVVGLNRTWLPDQFFGDGSSSWDQTYAITVNIPRDGGETLRYQAFWSSITVTAIGDADYAGLVKNGLDQAFRWQDDFIQGGDECSLDRDEPKCDDQWAPTR